MRALIVYESMYGNTRDIAKAIAEGMSSAVATQVVEVSQAPPVPDVDLLVVGAPTIVFGLSRPSTRAAAGGRTVHPLPADIGLRDWLAGLPQVAGRRDAVTFDTRLRVKVVPGSAAKGAARRLRKRGYRILWPSQSFHITRPSGPLADREVERAQLWGRWIGDGLLVKESRMWGNASYLDDDGTGAIPETA
jgi:Flavodoxin